MPSRRKTWDTLTPYNAPGITAALNAAFANKSVIISTTRHQAGVVTPPSETDRQTISSVRALDAGQGAISIRFEFLGGSCIVAQTEPLPLVPARFSINAGEVQFAYTSPGGEARVAVYII